ncbi:ABC transporter ATP-binding protein/permease [Mycoplasmatota bacterium]|nr:ABC transporter ATP-binding protein/permease [Mycoplasmatota bacterium]
MLKLVDIKKSYPIREGNDQVVLEHFNLELDSTGLVSILGTSGSGKTTLLNLLGALDKPGSGSILYEGNEINDLTSFRRDKIGFIFQHYNLIEHLSVLDNVLIVMSDDVVNKRKRAKSILVDVGLKEHIHKLPKYLSGGQKQRVAIARAIAKDVKILLCDEPLGNLDEKTGEKIADIIKELSKSRLVLFVTHNNEVATKYSDRIIYLKYGKIGLDSKNKMESTIEVDYSRKSYESFSAWLAFKNIIGRLKHSLKYVMLLSFILLITLVTIALDTHVFQQYMHERVIDKGVNNLILYVKEDSDELLSDLEEIDHVEHAGYIYDSKVEITYDLQSIATGSTSFESISGNERFKDIIIQGRYPENGSEILVTPDHVIRLLNELSIGGERLLQKYEAGVFSDEEVFNMIYRRNIILCYPSHARVKVVGLIDGKKIHDFKHSIYVLDEFFDLIDEEFKPVGVNLYKDNLFRDVDDQIRREITRDARVLPYDEYNLSSETEYTRVDGFLKLFKTISSIIILVSLIVLTSLMMTAFFERKYEIGLYRSFGYSKKNVTKILALEFLIIGTSSIVLGFGLFILFIYFVVDYFKLLNSISGLINSMNLLILVPLLTLLVLIFMMIIIIICEKVIFKDQIIMNLSDE